MDLHNFEIKAKAKLKKLDKEVSATNYKWIEKFVNSLIAENISWGRIYKYIFFLRDISQILDKDFHKATRRDIERVLRTISEKGCNRRTNKKYSENTKRDFRVVLKRFYKWLKKTEYEYPEEVRWIKTTNKNNGELPSILTEEEILKMIDVADTTRDKCLISILYESGMRIGELLGIKLRDIEQKDEVTRINIFGKTGSRRIILISSTPYLIRWLSSHPNKNKADSPLWVAMDKNKGLQMQYRTATDCIKNIGKKAGINKRIYPHLFRHSRATHLASRLSDQTLKNMFGWTPSSRQAQTYIHMSGRDVEESIKKMYGLVEEEPEDIRRPIKCPRCKEINPAKSVKCESCNLILDHELAIRVALEEQVKEDIVKIVLKKAKLDKNFIDQLLKEKRLEALVRSKG